MSSTTHYLWNINKQKIKHVSVYQDIILMDMNYHISWTLLSQFFHWLFEFL